MNRQQRRAGAKSNASALAVSRLQLGIAHFQAGRTADAEACFRQVLEEFPDYPDALHLLGYVAIATQRHAAGIELITRAIRHNPNNPEYYAHLGAGYSDLGRLQEALESYSSALKLRSNFPEVLRSRADVFAGLNRLEEALADYERAFSLKPDYVDAVSGAGMIVHRLGRHAEAETKFLHALRLHPQHLLTLIRRGALMRELKRFDEAVSNLTAAIALRSNVPEALHERGLVFIAIGRFAEAVSDLERAVSLKPGSAETYNDLGCALARTRQLEMAVENFRKALQIDPRHAGALNNLGFTLVDLNRPQEALGLLDQAIVISPGTSEFLNTKGVALSALGRFDEALGYFDRAIAADPGNAEAHLNIAINRLRLGDFQRGWSEYEWRWKCASQNLADRRFDKPLWLGAEPIAGKVVLLHNDQGLGDAMQFCRYVTRLSNLGAELILEIDSPLKDLLSRLPGISRCIAKGTPLPHFDFHCPLSSLPLAFSTTLDTIPSQVPYLPQASGEAARSLGPGKLPRIGLVWSGNASHTNDHNRSISFHQLLPLLGGVEAQFVSLQKDIRSEDEQLLRQRGDVLDLGPQLRDFSDTAAIVAQLDLVISVDTGVAHLAGGLGRPLWVLLPFIPDWRWLLDRDDSPWYPTARLFRQSAARDWAPVVAQVREALIERIARVAE
jgi:tetratricopeptide (TPR) repeat protein